MVILRRMRWRNRRRRTREEEEEEEEECWNDMKRGRGAKGA